MYEIAPNLYHIQVAPRFALNAYLLGDVLLDSGTTLTTKRVLKQLQGHTIRQHVLTHAHPDHMGASRLIMDELKIGLWCGMADAEAIEHGDYRQTYPANRLAQLERRLINSPSMPVAGSLHEGDEVGGFTVIETPGHTPGHLAFWRESDRVLIVGDVLLHMSFITWRTGLHEPLPMVTPQPDLNRASARKLAALQPRFICFGHGRPLQDGARFAAYVQSLPT